ncbi:DUF1570 domain-containing protein [Thalassoroseus pseudoceratinae]|uniref:DUF1570 domain-containing protein n=1 Tax=Thalassoroseus pseudoceratinae TaxID=2713176 RepID=UPI001420DBDD|nr:DUF1570 domain-containing protein [Thalassoroseus pseudoceratinae]
MKVLRRTSQATCLVWCLISSGIIISGCGDAKPSRSEASNSTVQSETRPPNTPVESDDQYEPVVPPQELTPATPPVFEPVTPPVAATNFRRADTRPVRDAAELASVGIHQYESKHLLLYTDIPAEIASRLPAFVDALYLEWERYFSPLPPDRDGQPFQMTGYLMKDRDLFRQMGLLPDDLPQFLNGRHRDREFWMNEQEFDYYRRHLLLHEATHCFMSVRRNNNLLPPVWYMEGMAEYFATHTVDADGKTVFGVMPHNKDDFAGLGRIPLIQQSIENGVYLNLGDVLELTPNDFLKNEAYAWSWALCYWLDHHPEYFARFQELGRTRSRPEFQNQFEKVFQSDVDDMTMGWGLFVNGLMEGYDVPRASVVETPAEPLPTAGQASIPVRADRGWQATGVEVKRGVSYDIRASGQVTLAQEPKPWVSEPGGITFDYFDGLPLGQLLLAVRDDTAGLQGRADRLLHPLPMGHEAAFMAPVDGTIYLRVNDRWNRLGDNSGHYLVNIREITE